MGISSAQRARRGTPHVHTAKECPRVQHLTPAWRLPVCRTEHSEGPAASPGAVTENRSKLHLPPRPANTTRLTPAAPSRLLQMGGHVLTAALNRQNCLFLKDCHIRAALVSGPGLPWHFSRTMLRGTW